MNEDWQNQLAALLAQNQPPDSYWDMMAQGDTLPAMMSDQAKNAYIARVQGFQPQQPQQSVPQSGAQTGLAIDKGGSGYKTPTQKQLNDARLMEMLRRRALASQ